MTSLPILQESAPIVRAEHVPGDVETKLAALWSLARARLWTRPHLWTSFSLQRRFQLRFLDPSRLTVKVPRGPRGGHLVPDCENCVELCCTGPNALVSLRLRDIARLVDRGFADRVVFDRPPTPKGPRWARKEADDSVFHRVFPVLARDATGTCLFLDEHRLCSLHPSWPLSCGRYPYALDLQSKVVFYAEGCTTTRDVTELPVDEAPLKVRGLVRAVVDAYNERVKDVVLLALARDELEDLGLARHLRLEHFPIKRRAARGT